MANALDVAAELFAVDTSDSVEAVLAVSDATTLGSDVASEGVFTTTVLVASVPPSVAAGEAAGEFAATLVRLDDDRSFLGCGVASAPVVSFPDSGVGVGVDWSAPRMSANVRWLRWRNFIECLGEPSVLGATSGVVDVVSPVGVEASLDSDSVEVFVRVEGPVGVFADAEPDAPLVPESLADEPDESEEGPAQATPGPEKTARPTPRAAASPPIRPIYLEAFIAFS